MSRLALKQYLSEVRLIFQDPFASLNPRMTVKQIVGDPLYVNDIAPGRAREDRVAELLRLVGLDPDTTDRYPLAFPAASASASASPAPSRSSPHHHRRRGQSARSAPQNPRPPARHPAPAIPTSSIRGRWSRRSRAPIRATSGCCAACGTRASGFRLISAVRRRRPLETFVPACAPARDSVAPWRRDQRTTTIAPVPGNRHDGRWGEGALPDAPGDVSADGGYHGEVFAATGGTPRVTVTAVWCLPHEDPAKKLYGMEPSDPAHPRPDREDQPAFSAPLDNHRTQRKSPRTGRIRRAWAGRYRPV